MLGVAGHVVRSLSGPQEGCVPIFELGFIFEFEKNAPPTFRTA
jgi:hypothetical protein